MSSGEMSFVRCLPQGFEIHFCKVIPSGVVFFFVGVCFPTLIAVTFSPILNRDQRTTSQRDSGHAMPK